MTQNVKIGCGTLALGLQYRILAKLLAYDLALYHPTIIFYVLTDDPASFKGQSNVRAVRHNFSGVRACYHDKRYVVSEVLKEMDVCVFLDADSRLINPIDFSDLIREGCFLVAPWAQKLSEKLSFEVDEWGARRSFNSPHRKKALFEKLSRKFDLSTSEIDFVQESMFAVNKLYGDHRRFLSAWDYCAIYSTLRLFEFSEGSSIGISARVSGGNVCSMSKNPSWYFKDLYTDVSWKNDDQKNISILMTALRESLGQDCGGRVNFALKLITVAWRYVKFSIRNRFGFYEKSNVLPSRI